MTFRTCHFYYVCVSAHSCECMKKKQRVQVGDKGGAILMCTSHLAQVDCFIYRRECVTLHNEARKLNLFTSFACNHEIIDLCLHFLLSHNTKFPVLFFGNINSLI